MGFREATDAHTSSMQLQGQYEAQSFPKLHKEASTCCLVWLDRVQSMVRHLVGSWPTAGGTWMLLGKSYDSSCLTAPEVSPSCRTALRFASWREKYTAMSAMSAGRSRKGGTFRNPNKMIITPDMTSVARAHESYRYTLS